MEKGGETRDCVHDTMLLSCETLTRYLIHCVAHMVRLICAPFAISSIKKLRSPYIIAFDQAYETLITMKETCKDEKMHSASRCHLYLESPLHVQIWHCPGRSCPLGVSTVQRCPTTPALYHSSPPSLTSKQNLTSLPKIHNSSFQVTLRGC